MATVTKAKRSPKARKVSKKAAAAKPARPGGTHVDFGLHGLGKILSAIHKAGLGEDLSDHLESSGQFVKVRRKSLTAIKDFVDSKPQLEGLAKAIGGCDCPPDDPGCVYIPG
ncbi:hypothetical protein Q3C01_16180 [Bradyrhizobium sp. UFLA05-109]